MSDAGHALRALGGGGSLLFASALGEPSCAGASGKRVRPMPDHECGEHAAAGLRFGVGVWCCAALSPGDGVHPDVLPQTRAHLGAEQPGDGGGYLGRASRVGFDTRSELSGPKCFGTKPGLCSYLCLLHSEQANGAWAASAAEERSSGGLVCLPLVGSAAVGPSGRQTELSTSALLTSALVLLLILSVACGRVGTADPLLSRSRFPVSGLILPLPFPLRRITASSSVLIAGRSSSIHLISLVVVTLQFPVPLSVLRRPRAGPLAGTVGVCCGPLPHSAPIGRTPFLLEFVSSSSTRGGVLCALSHAIGVGCTVFLTVAALTFQALRIIFRHGSPGCAEA